MGLFNFLFGGSNSRLIDPYERWRNYRMYQRNERPMSKDDALLMYRQLYDGAKSTFNNDDDYPNQLINVKFCLFCKKSQRVN